MLWRNERPLVTFFVLFVVSAHLDIGNGALVLIRQDSDVLHGGVDFLMTGQMRCDRDGLA